VVEGQAAVGQEGPDQLLVTADPPDALFGGVGDLDDGVAGEVGQLHPFRFAQRYSTGFNSGA
jgi:hypothetical protein